MGPQPAQAHPRCTKCNSPPITVLLYIGPLRCGFYVPVKVKYRWCNRRLHSGFQSVTIQASNILPQRLTLVSNVIDKTGPASRESWACYEPARRQGHW